MHGLPRRFASCRDVVQEARVAFEPHLYEQGDGALALLKRCPRPARVSRSSCGAREARVRSQPAATYVVEQDQPGRRTRERDRAIWPAPCRCSSWPSLSSCASGFKEFADHCDDAMSEAD